MLLLGEMGRGSAFEAFLGVCLQLEPLEDILGIPLNAFEPLEVSVEDDAVVLTFKGQKTELGEAELYHAESVKEGGVLKKAVDYSNKVNELREQIAEKSKEKL